MITRRHQEKRPERPLCSAEFRGQTAVGLGSGAIGIQDTLPVVAAPIRCAQSLLVDFSVEQTRQALHDIDAAWFLVARDPGVGMTLGFLFLTVVGIVWLCAWLEA
jgi:hypothetical protein